MSKKANEENWLITIDLDGTTIGKKSDDNMVYEIPEINKLAIKKLKELGHHVAIVTGRPWRLTKEIYELLEINTIVVNHNGAFIHRPLEAGFRSIRTGMNRKLVQEVLNTKILKDATMNAMIDFDESSWILNDYDEGFLAQFHVIKDRELRKFTLQEDMHEDPFSVAVRIDKKNNNTDEIITHLRRYWGKAFSFRYWNTGENSYSLEINPASASKGTALKVIASYYNIPMNRTIAFGDGLNDIQMIQEATMGIAMKNGVPILKEIADDITYKTNEEGGVGDYLNRFFDLEIKT